MEQNTFYRFRSIENLFGDYQELEKQTIYFASPEQQNDPMEGLIDLRWKGDYVLWMNLFVHYFRCLFVSVDQTRLLRPGEELKPSVFLTSSTFPELEKSDRFRKTLAAFLAQSDLRRTARRLGRRERTTGPQEALWLLTQVHWLAIGAMVSTAHMPFKQPLPPKTTSVSEQIEAFDLLSKKRRGTLQQSEAFHRLMSGAISEIELITIYNGPSKEASHKQLLFEHPRIYLRLLRKLVHSVWYSASFSFEPTNSSMWSHYASNHRGICLIFRTEVEGDGTCVLPLKGHIGVYGDKEGSRPISGAGRFEIHSVNYVEKHPEIEFFDTLGSLSLSVLHDDWYSFRGLKSARSSKMLEDDDEWRSQYWTGLEKNACTKTSDWHYEKEARLVLTGVLGEKSSEARTWKYDFKSLEGIIFGINTAEAERTNIMRVIEKKCRDSGREDFKFYQAYYDPESGKIEADEMNFIKWK